MGRREPSSSQPPASVRRASRAKFAKETANKTIPALLASSARAKKGVESAELIVDPSPSAPHADAQVYSTIRVVHADSITAALALYTRFGRPASTRNDAKAIGRIALLNMASALRPGGGFFQGATSQEEALCMRTTLYPSLQDAFYRLPEVGVVYSPDVLVFRDGSEPPVELRKNERAWVDVVSAAMLRDPELEDPEGEKRWTAAERGLAHAKMRAVMRVCAAKGVRAVVLGAWGCGAYGNPVEEVAGAWKEVLLGKGRGEAERWPGVREVVFAITDRRMVDVFRARFWDVLQEEESDREIEGDEGQGELGELEQKIAELVEQLKSVKTPALRERLGTILDGLQKQLVAQQMTSENSIIRE